MGAGQSASEMASRKREQARRLEEDAERWERGAEGERRVAALLNDVPATAALFHDLRIPGSKANIDHLVIAPGGVFVIDTKNFTNAVTLGRGRGADRLWTGGRPIRLESTIWEATEVARRLGVEVVPVLCVIAPSMPSPAFEFGGVRVCSPHRLLLELRRGAATVDAERVADHVQAMFGAPPDRAPVSLAPPVTERFEVGPAGEAATVSARHRRSGPRRRSRADRIVRAPIVRWQPLVRFLSVALGFLVLMAALPALSRAISGLMTAPIQDAVEFTARSETTAPSAHEPVSPRPVGLAASCASPGTGWMVSLAWPGAPPSGATGYGLRWRIGDGPEIDHLRRAWVEPDDGPAALLVPNGAELLVTTDALDESGAILGSISQRFVPAAEC